MREFARRRRVAREVWLVSRKSEKCKMKKAEDRSQKIEDRSQKTEEEKKTLATKKLKKHKEKLDAD